MVLILPKRKTAGGSSVSEVFSADYYIGGAAGMTINNGLDLSGLGGLVWIESVSGSTVSVLTDTVRGAPNYLDSGSVAGEITNQTEALQSFNPDGFTLGNWATVSGNGHRFMAYSFVRQPRFFDIVRYTGDGVAGRTVAHNLECVPGMIVVKDIVNSINWTVYHRGTSATDPETDALYFHQQGFVDSPNFWNDTAPTDTEFSLGSGHNTNRPGGEFIAYVFAHDTEDTGFIQCGRYEGDTSSVKVDLPWRPQVVLIKRVTGSESWHLFDSKRGGFYQNTKFLAVEQAFLGETNLNTHGVHLLSDGFEVFGTDAGLNGSTDDYAFVAIRADDSYTSLNAPPAVEDVYNYSKYAATSAVQSITTGVDLSSGNKGLVWIKDHDTNLKDHYLFDTERGAGNYISTNQTGQEYNIPSSLTDFTATGFDLGGSTLVNNSAEGSLSQRTLKAAPRFFDIVTYTGDGVQGRDIAHNLQAPVGMIIIKNRTLTRGWSVYHKAPGARYVTFLNGTGGASLNGAQFANTEPTETHFTVGGDLEVNGSGHEYVAYVFANDFADDGMVRVGEFRGNGTGGFNAPEVDLGWRPQLVILKTYTTNGFYFGMFHEEDGQCFQGNSAYLQASSNSSFGQVGYANIIGLTSTGFKLRNNAPSYGYNSTSQNIMFLAIRAPEGYRDRNPAPVATEHFCDMTFTGNFSTKVVTGTGVDLTSGDAMVIAKSQQGPGQPWWVSDTVNGITAGVSLEASTARSVQANSITALGNDSITFGANSTVNNVTTNQLMIMKKAPRFFDIVTYTGDGSSGRVIPHGLDCPVGMIWLKPDSGTAWRIYSHDGAGGFEGILFGQQAWNNNPAFFQDTKATEENFTVGNAASCNANGVNCTAYVFANDESPDGMIRCGAFIGTNNAITGPEIVLGWKPRFVFIKNAYNGEALIYTASMNGSNAWTVKGRLHDSSGLSYTGDRIDVSDTGFRINSNDSPSNALDYPHAWMAIR
jgi:hypothetical protein